MKSTPVLTAALAFSLFVNFVLWAHIERESRAATIAVGTASANAKQSSRGAVLPARSSAAAHTDATLRGVVWRRTRTPEEWRAFADDLRAAGFPEGLLRSLVWGAAYEDAQSKGALGKLPFWHQAYEAKAAREERERLSRAMNAIDAAVFGKQKDIPIDPIRRAARYGNLPDDKIAVLMKIEQDYGEVYWQQRRSPDGTDALETFEGRARIRLLEEEKERDLAAVLTPEQFEDYERRGSRVANLVISGVRDIDVSEEEYEALFQLQRRTLAMIPRTAGPDEALAFARGSAAAAEDVRAVLRDDRFYSYMEHTDPLYGAAAKFAKANPGLTPATTHALYQLQLEAVTALARTAGTERASDLASQPEGRAALAPLGAKLDALLGPQLATAYRKTPQGKIFPSDGKP